MESDAQLIAATLDGNRAAFATLIGRYERVVHAIGFDILRDHHAAEDAAQETFVAAYRSLAALTEPSAFGRWLLKIARHQALRLSTRRRGDAPLELAADVRCPEGETLEHDSEHLMAMVMRLPERQRRLIMLRHFAGHTATSIARMQGRPVGTITKQLSRSYARLREHLVEVVS